MTGVQTCALPISAEGMPDEYDGSKFDLTTTSSNVDVFVSGNETEGTKDAHSRCTFYGANEGVELKAAIAAGGFTASASVAGVDTADSAMNFSQGDVKGSNLEVGITKDSCRSGLTGGADNWSANNVTASSTSAVLATTFATLTKSNTVAIQSDTPGQNSACRVAQVVSISIPSEKTPTYPGKTYT